MCKPVKDEAEVRALKHDKNSHWADSAQTQQTPEKSNSASNHCGLRLCMHTSRGSVWPAASAGQRGHKQEVLWWRWGVVWAPLQRRPSCSSHWAAPPSLRGKRVWEGQENSKWSVYLERFFSGVWTSFSGFSELIWFDNFFDKVSHIAFQPTTSGQVTRPEPQRAKSNTG